jgi:hypothetical protein
MLPSATQACIATTRLTRSRPAERWWQRYSRAPRCPIPLNKVRPARAPCTLPYVGRGAMLPLAIAASVSARRNGRCRRPLTRPRNVTVKGRRNSPQTRRAGARSGTCVERRSLLTTSARCSYRTMGPRMICTTFCCPYPDVRAGGPRHKAQSPNCMTFHHSPRRGIL